MNEEDRQQEELEQQLKEKLDADLRQIEDIVEKLATDWTYDGQIAILRYGKVSLELDVSTDLLIEFLGKAHRELEELRNGI